MAREINLVPDIKNEMIKALKLRNYIFFACIVIAAASIGAIVFFGIIAGGQQLARDQKKEVIKQLSDKLHSYSDLNDMVTIKDQLNNIGTLTDNKQVLSRTFSALSAMIPTGADTITISELSVNLAPSPDETEDFSTEPTFTLEAQANAGKEPFIDYNVLDSFKKSMQYLHFDYGKYVDRDGNTIPAYCIIEQGDDGATFKENKNGQDNYYAFWTIDGEGCNPSDIEEDSTEEYNNQKVIRIWRTPQFEDWYQETENDDDPYMGLDGTIKNVEHFESACITYSGEIKNDHYDPKWTDDNTCYLVEGSDEEGISGIEITESSNGRDSSNELVLRFSSIITLNPEFFNFSNTHMLALAPSGRRNVTDSYVQIQTMFGERAADCAKDDPDCNSNNSNTDNAKEKSTLERGS